MSLRDRITTWKGHDWSGVCYLFILGCEDGWLNRRFWHLYLFEKCWTKLNNGKRGVLFNVISQNYSFVISVPGACSVFQNLKREHSLVNCHWQSSVFYPQYSQLLFGDSGIPSFSLPPSPLLPRGYSYSVLWSTVKMYTLLSHWLEQFIIYASRIDVFDGSRSNVNEVVNRSRNDKEIIGT